ncbi:sulfotransferase domain-containing protein [Parvicella tangerina]|uniref:Sulfotransferase domain-containing protein n=1 Tax=Parvicella tangerina TaxID=2829795 RepID=A0A916JL16_9FLAO|nr:sulfotransferase domain-containing protein [Parvicella tangerina]CAG5079765.1 hypothetical protein CRYO30217_01055 [Parvicella tangerina]
MSNERNILPNLIIGGSPKCGTSSLFYWLKDHPEICASNIKETGFLLDKVWSFNEVNYITHGLEGYSRLFPSYRGEKIIMEATPGYLLQEKIPFECLAQFKEMPKVVFIFRKPSQRIFSDYNFQKNSQKEISDDMSFDDFLKSRRGEISRDTTRYAKYLKNWQKKIGAENVHVYILEELKKSPKKFLIELSKDLEIDAAFWEEYSFDVKNKTVNISNMGFHMKLLKLSNLVPSFVKKSKLKNIYYKLNSKKAAAPVDYSKQKQLIDQEFVPEVEELEELLGRKIEVWK